MRVQLITPENMKQKKSQRAWHSGGLDEDADVEGQGRHKVGFFCATRKYSEMNEKSTRKMTQSNTPM